MILGLPKADVFLLAGFLGAGKTTLMKEILSWKEDLSGTLVIINEFGQVGIDGALLKGLGSEVVELASGCICCSLGPDLIRTLSETFKQFKPRRILIETSGLADPTAVRAILKDRDLREAMALKKVITVLDPRTWEVREVFGSVFYNQLREADLILLNKVDLLDPLKRPEILKEIHAEFPGCRVIPAVQGRMDPQTFWQETEIRGPALSSLMEPSQSVAAQEAGFVTFSFQESGLLDETCFRQFVADMPFELFRMKGSVAFENKNFFINHVGGRSDWIPGDQTGGTRLAFVGWGINPDAFRLKLKRCLIQSR